LSSTHPPGGFPRARGGYDRSAVDAHVRELSTRLDRSAAENAAQAERLRAVTAELAELRAAHERLLSATLEQRAQDVLDAAAAEAAERVAAAEATARDLVTSAQREIEVLEERARQELAWRRRRLSADQAELTAQKEAMRAQLASFRAVAHDAALLPERVSSEQHP
jgi:cell division septum initiation protein DivIVA